MMDDLMMRAAEEHSECQVTETYMQSNWGEVEIMQQEDENTANTTTDFIRRKSGRF